MSIELKEKPGETPRFEQRDFTKRQWEVRHWLIDEDHKPRNADGPGLIANGEETAPGRCS